MWKIFLKSILDISGPIHLMRTLPTDFEKYKNSHILIYPTLYSVNNEGTAKIVQIKNPELLKRFLKQAHEQEEHFDIDELTAYPTYMKEFERFKRGEISRKEIDKVWLDLGMQLRNMLPPHMLMELCSLDNSWGTKSQFDSEEWPSDPKVYINSNNQPESVLLLIDNTGLGYNFSIFRGVEDVTMGLTSPIIYCDSLEGVQHDHNTLRHLQNVRKVNLEKLCSQLPELSSAKTNKIELQ